MQFVSAENRRLFRQWSPALIAAGSAWLIILFVGETPLSRASGMALTILGVTASMRQMGFVASIAGGLTLALCPVFWSQTGGGSSEPATIVVAAGIAIVAMLIAARLMKRSDLGIGAGIATFLLIFWGQVGTAQSLRLTGLVTAWLLYLLADMILMTNPRPGIKPAKSPKTWHTFGLLFLFVIGALNDSLVTLFTPAILLALFLSYVRLPTWYWLGFFAAICLGGFLLARDYLPLQPEILDLWGWREAIRWIDLGDLVVAQFGIIGIILGVIGLARLSRWYPPLGTVTMFAYGAYVFFGLVYLGKHSEILLTPLFIIQVMWMTYAMNTIGQWANKTLGAESGIWIHLVSAIYFLVPVILLLRILQS